MYLICINLGLGRYVPEALVNINQIHHSYTCYNYNIYHSVSKILKKDLLSMFKSSAYFSLMEDDSMDVTSKEELSICALWEQGGKPVKHFLGIVLVKETTAQLLPITGTNSWGVRALTSLKCLG